ncbi:MULTISPECIES: hypothetical protein [Pseudofrankia]|uniref:hypothetical protein n=1 Tax=Pseudofrankia TaxID=2994363 RepID=UPI000234C4A7|nr:MULTISPECIES: hypothetical protein [Pseudofrankia]OHV29181.1 hypothetical protein BCD49_36505 [Pseudofrankia sp. EUN1h]
MLLEDNVALIEQRVVERRDQLDGVIRLFDFIPGMQMENRSVAHALTFTDVVRFTRLTDHTAAAFEPLPECGRAGGLVRSGTEVDDVMVAFPMEAAALAVSDADMCERLSVRARAMLHQASST